MLAATAFFPWVLPKVPGCSSPLAQQAVVDSAIAFCEESQAVRQWVTPISTVAGTSAYTLSGDADQQVSRVLAVLVDNYPIQAAPRSQEGYAQTGDTSRPAYYYTKPNGADVDLVLHPTPDSVFTVKVLVALRPRRGASQLTDELYHQWVEPITAGALYRILMTPGQPFTDTAGGALQGQLAVSGARKARIASESGQVRTTSAVTMRPFA